MHCMNRYISFPCTRLPCRITLFFFILVCGWYPLDLQAIPAEQDSIAVPDSVQCLRQQLDPKSFREKAISLPTQILFSPLVAMGYGVEASITWYLESDQAYWLRQLLKPRIVARGVLPAYSRRSGYGLKYYDKNFFSSGAEFTAVAKAGEKGRQKFQIKIDHLAVSDNVFFMSDIYYRFLTIEAFYGFGPNSVRSNRSSFSHEIIDGRAAVGFELGPAMRLSLFAAMDLHNILAGRDDDHPSTTAIYTPKSLPGLDTGLRFHSVGVDFQLDSRNQKGMPCKGWQLYAGIGRYRQMRRTRFGFYKFEADIRHYLHLFRRRLLVVRLATEVTEALPNRQIPFFYASQLGRHETIRGFNRGRFRDRDLILGSVEYRYPVWNSISAHIYVDGGKVSPAIEKALSFERLHYSTGAGIRIAGTETLFLKMEFGISHDGYRFYLNLND